MNGFKVFSGEENIVRGQTGPMSDEIAKKLLAISLSKEELFPHFKSNPLLVDSWLKDAGLTLKIRVSVCSELERMQAIEQENSENEWGDVQTSSSTWLNRLYYVPLVNFVIEIFFDDTPPIEAIKTILELLGIMGALLFSLIVGCVVSIDYNRFQDAKDRWDTGIYSNCYRDIEYPNGVSIGQGMIEWFVKHIYESMRASFCSFLIIIFVYLLLSATKFESRREKDVWWRWIKWAVLLSVALIVVALGNLFTALQNLLEWSVPNDEYTLIHGCNNLNGVLANDKNIWGWNSSNTFLMFAVCALLFSITTSIAIINKRWVSAQKGVSVIP
jgi:hypothetical protein